MKVEKTPEEKARTKRTNANVMMAAGAIMSLCGLAGGLIVLSGRGDVPDWMFGGARAARAKSGDWTNAAPAVAFADWGAAPFARAKKEGKLVLLFLGPSYSAPTARMAAETFSDPAVAAFVDSRLIPVRVNAEEFPDLDRRYRAGGWPTVALLLSDGVVLDAGTSMTPDMFRRWAGALADKASAQPELLARAAADAAARRAADAASRVAGRTPPAPAAAEAAAQAALMPSWDPSRRTFDRRGPRFPRFERAAALASLSSPWAKALADEAVKGTELFQDPRDGGFFRAANPDGSPAAREKTAAGQAAALDALCGRLPQAAARALVFLEKDFSAKGDAWRGWQSGYALDARRFKASDGEDFDRFRADGWREMGPARLSDDAELARAVLACAEASPAQKARARRVSSRAFAEFSARAKRKDPRLLLDDAVALGPALLGAGETAKAAAVWKWMEDALGGAGPAYFDRLATGLLPPEADRLADSALNARALVFTRALAAALPKGPEHAAVSRRAEALYFWLSARPDSLDPAVWAALAAQEPR